MLDSPFLRAVSRLAAGSVLAQLIAVAAAPVFTRLFTPEDLGFYTYLLSVTAIFMGVINVRYDAAIVFAEESEVPALVKGGLVVGLALSVVVGVACAFYAAITMESVFLVWGTLAFIVMVLGTYAVINVLTAYNNRLKDYGAITAVTVLRSLGQNAGGIIAGLLGTGSVGLLATYVFGQWLGIARQARSMRGRWGTVWSVPWAAVIRAMSDHRRQAAFSAPALLVNGASYGLIVLLLGGRYGLVEVGLYSISLRVLGLPLAIISGNVGRVFFEEAAREREQSGHFRNALKRSTLMLSAIAVPLWALLTFVVPLLIEPLFGQGWDRAGVYVVLLAPMFSVRFVVSALSPAFLVAKRQSLELAVSLALVVACVGSFVFSVLLDLSVVGFINLVNASFALTYLVCFGLIAWLSIEGDSSGLNPGSC